MISIDPRARWNPDHLLVVPVHVKVLNETT